MSLELLAIAGVVGGQGADLGAGDPSGTGAATHRRLIRHHHAPRYQQPNMAS